jgi:hypothetical protein
MVADGSGGFLLQRNWRNSSANSTAPPPPRFTRQPQKEKMFLASLIFAGGGFFSKMERTFFFLGFCPPSIRAVWRGFNSDFGKAENLFIWGKGFFRFASD